MAGLRIVAGDFGGRRLKVPRKSPLRPTGERVREAVFSVLWSLGGDPRGGERVLDLFAGTGALGFEALSRGYESCVFVESAPEAASAIRENAGALGVEERVELLQCDYRRGLAILGNRETRFDLLFADPPYRMLPDALAGIAGHIQDLTGSGDLLVLEGPAGMTLNQEVLEAVVEFRRAYGDTEVAVLKKR